MSQLPIADLVMAAAMAFLAARLSRELRLLKCAEAAEAGGDTQLYSLERVCYATALVFVFSLVPRLLQEAHLDHGPVDWTAVCRSVRMALGLAGLYYCVRILLAGESRQRRPAQFFLAVLALTLTALLVVKWPYVTVAELRIAAGGGHPTATRVWLKLGAPANGGLHHLRPLEVAARAGDVRTLKVLLDAGAQVNAADATAGRTALHCAAEEGHLACVEFLLDHGADPNAPMSYGLTPLFGAAYYNRPAVVKLLLQRGATPSLHAAAAMGDVELTRALVARGDDPNACDGMGCPPLHWAIVGKHAEEVSCLLACGAGPRRFAYDGEYPLQDAVFADVAPVVTALLRGGAPPDLPDQKWHATALHYAASKGYRDIVQTLIAGRANVNALDYNGATPLDWAALKNRRAVIELLRGAGGQQHVTDVED